MKLKKMALVLTGALVSLALVGCGGGDQGKQAAKTLRVGSAVDFAPFEFQDEGQKEYQGFDMDLIRAVAKEMGSEAEIQNIGFIISGMTINDERKQKVNFSDPYYQSGLTMIVRSDEEAIKSFKDLKGHKVAVQIGTTSANMVKEMEGVTVTELNTPADCFMELKARGVDAVVNDRPVNDYYIKQTQAVGVKSLEDKLSAEDYGIAMGKDNADLQKKVNEALKKLHDNGEYDKIYQKWFGASK